MSVHVILKTDQLSPMTSGPFPHYIIVFPYITNTEYPNVLATDRSSTFKPLSIQFIYFLDITFVSNWESGQTLTKKPIFPN